MANANEMKQFVSDMASPDLAFILDDVGLSMEYQYRLVKAGYKTVRRVAAVADTQAEARTTLKDITEINPDDGPAQCLALTILVDTWNVCKVTAEK